MKRIFRVIAACFAMFAVLCISPSVTAAKECSDTQAMNWYVKRNSEHRQPVADPCFTQAEQYDAYYVDKRHTENSEEKVVYLTFDAGYENGNIARILDTLREEKVPAAFFILKHLITKETALVERMATEGHLVCNHTMSHKDMTLCSDRTDFEKEIIGLEELYTQMTGKELAKYYRPPEGKYTLRNLMHAKELGYKSVFWSFAYADWDNDRQPSAEEAKQKIWDNLHNGAVLLLHPTSKTNADILQEVIQTLKAEGYRFGTLDELTGEAKP